MKITLIAPTFIPARRANTVQVMKMAQALQVAGHEVEVTIPDPKGRTAVSITAEMDPAIRVRVRGTQVSWNTLADHYGLSHFFRMTWLPARARLRRYDYAFGAVLRARKEKTDVIYTRLPQAAAASSMLGSKTILEIHDYPQGCFGPLFFKLFLRGSGGRRLVSITQALTDDLLNQFQIIRSQEFLQVLPDGVDLTRFDNLPSQVEARASLGLPLPPEKFVIGYTGHLYPGRGVEMILNLAAQLPDMSFLLVGGDPKDIDRVTRLVNERSLVNVILAGFQTNRDLPLYQAACDLLVMPYQEMVSASSGGDISRYLSPMKLFEYMASGRPTLSSDLPVLREILNEENAVLLPPEEVTAWSAAIQQLNQDPVTCKQLARQAQRDIQNYTWEKRAARILSSLE